MSDNAKDAPAMVEAAAQALLDGDGLLPEGVHDLSIDEIEQHFGQFRKSTRRMSLFAKLKEFVAEVRGVAMPVEVLVDGSFVMASIDEPGDIDIVLVLPESWTKEQEVRPFEHNLISKKRVKSRFGFDVFAVPQGSSAKSEMVAFFQQVNVKWRQNGSLVNRPSKGIVRVRA